MKKMSEKTIKYDSSLICGDGITDIIIFNETASTNALIGDIIRRNKGSSTYAVLAESQTQGRGRYGRSFFSPAEGGIYLSYAFPCSLEDDELLRITTVTASIVHEVLSRHADDLHIKWINDILRGSRKVAGILAERIDLPSSDKRPDYYYIIIGAGINCYNAGNTEVPEELSETIGYLFDTGIPEDAAVTRSIIANELICEFDRNFAPIASDGTKFYPAADFDRLTEYYRENCPTDVPI